MFTFTDRQVAQVLEISSEGECDNADIKTGYYVTVENFSWLLSAEFTKHLTFFQIQQGTTIHLAKEVLSNKPVCLWVCKICEIPWLGLHELMQPQLSELVTFLLSAGANAPPKENIDLTAIGPCVLEFEKSKGNHKIALEPGGKCIGIKIIHHMLIRIFFTILSSHTVYFADVIYEQDGCDDAEQVENSDMKTYGQKNKSV